MTTGPAREIPVTVRAGTLGLPGILHRPTAEGALGGTGVVIVPGGLIRRAGLHRLYTVAARAFADRGAAALRFDLPGTGECEGQPRALTPEGFASLEARHAEEIRAAMDCLEREAAPERLVLLGHCASARGVAESAAEDSRARAVIAWSMPLGTDGSPAVPAWLGRALRRLLDGPTPTFWAYGTRDPAWEEFKAFVSALSGPERERLRGAWALRSIPRANHDFTSVAWTREVIEASIGWLVRSRQRDAARSRGAWTSR